MIVLLFSLIIVCCFSNDEIKHELFAKTIGSVEYDLPFSAIDVYDSLGIGFIIYGTTENGVSDRDVFLIRLDVEGSIVWSARYGFVSGNREVDTFGGMYQRNSDGMIVCLCSHGHGEVVIFRVDPLDGDIVFQRQYDWNGFTNVILGKMFEDSSGNTWAAGQKYTWQRIQNLPFLVKFDSSGNVIFARSYCLDQSWVEGGGYDIIPSYRDDGAIITGVTRAYSGNNDLDVFVMKVNNAGNLVWGFALDGPDSEDDSALKLRPVRNSDRFMLVGQTYLSTFMVQFSEDGNIIFAKQYVPNGFEGFVASGALSIVQSYHDEDVFYLGLSAVKVHALDLVTFSSYLAVRSSGEVISFAYLPRDQFDILPTLQGMAALTTYSNPAGDFMIWGGHNPDIAFEIRSDKDPFISCGMIRVDEAMIVVSFDFTNYAVTADEIDQEYPSISSISTFEKSSYVPSKFNEKCYSCDRIYANDSDVCNSHGNCMNNFFCSCDEFYYGEYCSVTLCDGIISNETDLVCSGRGDCNEYEICSCHPNYYGEACNITTCGGIYSNESDTCGGGVCLEYNTCDEIYFFGQSILPTVSQNEYVVDVNGTISKGYNNTLSGGFETEDGRFMVCGEALDTRNDERKIGSSVMRLDESGKIVWVEFFMGEEEEEDVRCVSLSGGVGEDAVVLMTSSSSDSHVLNIDEFGNVGWIRTFSGSEDGKVMVLYDEEEIDTYNKSVLVTSTSSVSSTSVITYLSNQLYGSVIWNGTFDSLVIHDFVFISSQDLVIFVGMNLTNILMFSITVSTNTILWVQDVKLSGHSMEYIDTIQLQKFHDVSRPYDMFFTIKMKLNESSNNQSTSEVMLFHLNYDVSWKNISVVRSTKLTSIFTGSYISVVDLKDSNQVLFVTKIGERKEEEDGGDQSAAITLTGSNFDIASFKVMDGEVRSIDRSKFGYVLTGSDDHDWYAAQLDVVGETCSSGDFHEYDLITNQDISSLVEFKSVSIGELGYILSTSPPLETEEYIFSSGPPLVWEGINGVTNLSCWSCQGMFKSDYHVCSDMDHSGVKRGKCSETFQCECFDQYYGEECEDFDCWSINHNDSNVCSGHGQCADANYCKCDYGYIGDSCEFWSCWGEYVTSEDVCAGHGICVSVDICYCSIGYSSTSLNGVCDQFFCGDKFKNESGVCNSHGTCIALNDCDCGDSGYEGDDCSQYRCGYVKSDDSNVCNTHGTCVGPDECDCSTLYYGDECEVNGYAVYVVSPILITLFLIFCCALVCFCACVFISFLCCCLIFIVVTCSCSSAVSALTGVNRVQKYRMKKFAQLKNVDLLLKEQELDDDESVAHLRINKDLFEIPFDEIEVMNVLGEGGSNSVVFKAKWRQQEVAFKCFKTRFICTSQENYNEFEREVEILGSINHPSIIRFFGATMNPPRVGILMEYCPNGDLSQFLEKWRTENGGRMYPLHEKVRMLSEIIGSIDYIHSRSIIHRDLKLENILVDAQQRCKLMDFGLSKIQVERENSQNQTKKVGTNIYMAPELIDGDYNELCDAFSFAILMYVLITERENNPYSEDENDTAPASQNIELKVANDPNFRPPLRFLDDKLGHKYAWISPLVEVNWKHDPMERWSFRQISDYFKDGMVGNLESQKFFEETEHLSMGVNERRKRLAPAPPSRGNIPLGYKKLVDEKMKKMERKIDLMKEKLLDNGVDLDFLDVFEEIQ